MGHFTCNYIQRLIKLTSDYNKWFSLNLPGIASGVKGVEVKLVQTMTKSKISVFFVRFVIYDS
jgi:hypothetical protein